MGFVLLIVKLGKSGV